MSPCEWVLTSTTLLLAVTVMALVLALAYSPQPPEDSPYE